MAKKSNLKMTDLQTLAFLTVNLLNKFPPSPYVSSISLADSTLLDSYIIFLSKILGPEIFKVMIEFNDKDKIKQLQKQGNSFLDKYVPLPNNMTFDQLEEQIKNEMKTNNISKKTFEKQSESIFKEPTKKMPISSFTKKIAEKGKTYEEK